jgi:hypothetical protein
MSLIWKGHSWLQQERWGSVHPIKPHWWYDPSSSFVDDNGFLNLLTKKNPKYFPEIDKISTIGVGLVSCEQSQIESSIDPSLHTTFEFAEPKYSLKSQVTIWCHETTSLQRDATITDIVE